MKWNRGTSWKVVFTIALVLPAAWAADAAGQEVAKPAGATDEGLSYRPPSWPEPPDAGAMLRRLGLGTAAVLVLCAGTLWIGKRWLRGTPVKGAGGGQLHLVETVALGNRCAVHLLRAGHQQVLVGVDGSGLKTVVALPPIFDTSLSEAQSAETCVADSKLEPALHVAV